MNEMSKLINLLEGAKIPYEIFEQPFGVTKYTQVYYPNKKNNVCDVICNPMSYGHEKGLLEIMGLTENDDDVEGYLTSMQVFTRINNHYKGTK